MNIPVNDFLLHYSTPEECNVTTNNFPQRYFSKIMSNVSALMFGAIMFRGFCTFWLFLWNIMLSKYYAKCEILILAKYLYSCHSSNLIRVKIHANYLEGWQKADNIDISDFSGVSFLCKWYNHDKTKQYKLQKFL